MIWLMEPNLGLCLQIWDFNALLGFSSEDLGFYLTAYSGDLT